MPVAIVKERDSNKRVAIWRKCTGVDVLEEREIPGRFVILVFPVYGDEVDLDGRRSGWRVRAGRKTLSV